MKKLFFVVFFACSYVSFSQESAPVVDWLKVNVPDGVISNGMNDIIMDKNYNIYLAGTMNRPDRTVFFTMAKFASGGDSLFWITYETTPSATDEVRTLALDSEMNIYGIGNTYSGGIQVSPLFLKYNSSGEFLWVKNFNYITEPTSVAADIKLFADNTIAFAYYILDSFHDYTVVKGYSPAGDSLWSVTLKDDTSHYRGTYLVGDNTNFVYAIVPQIYNLSEPFTSANIILLKINSVGEIIWRRDLGEFMPDRSVMDKEQNIILISQSGGQVKKINPDGEIVWSYMDEDSLISPIYYNCVIDNENNIIVTGHIKNSTSYWDYITTKISASGEEIWSVQFNSDENIDDIAEDVTADEKGNIYVTGYSSDENYQGPCYTVKYSKDGSFVWKYRLNPPGAVQTLSKKIFTDDSSNVYVGGNSRNSINIDGYVLLKLKQTGDVDVEENNGKVPAKFILEQNYPNPFNPSTTIRYSIPAESFVTLKIYDILGNEIQTLVSEVKPAGEYKVEFNANNLASGVYIYKMTSLNYISERKMLVIK